MAPSRIHNPAYSADADAVTVQAKVAELDGLRNKKVALLVNAWPSWVEMADRLGGKVENQFDGVTISKYLVPNGSAAAPALLEEIAKSNDAAIVGLANCGSCTAWSFHDSAELMKQGMPVVWVATSEFEGLAHALAEARNIPVPTVVLPTNPETIELPQAFSMLDEYYDAILECLLEQPTGEGGPHQGPDGSRFIELKSDASVQDYLYEQGLTDGLPVEVPTEERVAEMLAGADPDLVIGNIPPTYYPLTLGSLATNAVMAGCRPEYFSTLRAIAEAACVHEYNLNGIATTTGPSTPMIVVNGPMREVLGMNSGRGVLGPGTRANATIGRALRLIINNVGGAKPGTISKSIHGQPGRYTFCIAEDEERSPWEPLHVTLGFDRDESAITLLGATGTINIMTPRQGAHDMIEQWGDAFASMGSPNVMMGKGTVAVLITAGHAAHLAQSGYSKADVAREIWETARIPLARFPEHVRPDPPYEFALVGDYVHAVKGPENVYVIVVGGVEPTHSTVIPSHPSCIPVSRAIR